MSHSTITATTTITSTTTTTTTTYIISVITGTITDIFVLRINLNHYFQGEYYHLSGYH